MDVTITLGPGVFHVVRTGDKFVLRTSDPVKRPLPSKEVLDFQLFFFFFFFCRGWFRWLVLGGRD